MVPDRPLGRTRGALHTSPEMSPSEPFPSERMPSQLCESSLAAGAYQSCCIRPGAGLRLRRNSQKDRRAAIVNKWRDLGCRDKNGADIQKRATQWGHTALGFMERGLRQTAYQFPSSAPTRLHSMALSWVLRALKNKPTFKTSELAESVAIPFNRGLGNDAVHDWVNLNKIS